MAKSYVRDTSGLKRYHQAKREAKKYGGAYADYVERYYRASKGLRVGTGKKKGGVSTKGIRVLTYNEFMIDTTSENISTRQLIKEQFGLMSSDKARHLKNILKEHGFDISLQRAATRQLSQREWSTIDEYYDKLKSEGLDSTAAANEIATYFFGS